MPSFVKTKIYILALCLSPSISFTACAVKEYGQNPPIFRAETLAGKFSQSGFVENPPSLEQADSVVEIPLPKDTRVKVSLPSPEHPGEISLVLSADSSIKSVSNQARILGLKSFAPPSPPSAQELAVANGLKNSYYLAGGLLLVGLGMLYTKHTKAGVLALVAAILTPVFARFVSSDSGYIVCLIGVCISGAIFAAWHFLPKAVKEKMER